jgi:fructose-1,6-bisphosphatase
VNISLDLNEKFGWENPFKQIIIREILHNCSNLSRNEINNIYHTRVSDCEKHSITASWYTMPQIKTDNISIHKKKFWSLIDVHKGLCCEIFHV